MASLVMTEPGRAVNTQADVRIQAAVNTEAAVHTEAAVETGAKPAAAPGLLPIARVAVDSPLPHLDRPFDYLIPAELDDLIQVGSRVRVRFAGRLVDGWVLQRVALSAHAGSLATVQRGLGPEPVLTPETAALFRTIADRWAGSFADVMRLAVPARHARAESADMGISAPDVAMPDAPGWSCYGAGPAFLSAVQQGLPARAVWNCLPDEQWPERIAELVQLSLFARRGVIVVVPDAREVARVEQALAAVLPRAAFLSLTAQLGPETRYRRWLAVRRGAVQAVIGTRSAIYAPVRDLGLIVLFDDGDDLLAEPRAPYPHARDVAVLRSATAKTALMIGGFARTAESALLVESGWAHDIVAERSVIRKRSPRIVATGDDFELARDPLARVARLPALAFRTARAALDSGRPVLIQVARSGYAPTLACALDRTPVRCAHCHGPVEVSGEGAVPSCRWCGRSALGWRCPRCSGVKIRATILGAVRTAEEIGRAFPSVVLRSSGGENVLAELTPGPAIVISTPGAEPRVAGGYGAVLLLDGWAMLSRPDLRAAEETLRRWFNAAALAAADGTVLVGADAELGVTQALIRWDPSGYASRELADRRELNFPPVSRLAALTGAPADVSRLLAATPLPVSAEELGTVEVHPRAALSRRSATGRGNLANKPDLADQAQVRTLIRVTRADGPRLAEALHAAAATASAKKVGQPVRIELDPAELS